MYTDTTAFMTFRQWIMRSVLVLALVAGAVSLQSTLVVWNMEQLYKWLRLFGQFAPALLSLCIVAQSIAAPWTGTWLLVAGSNFYTPWLGWLAVWVGTLVGNWLAYELARFLFKPIHSHLSSFRSKLGVLNPVFIILYAIPLFPVAVISWLLGLVAHTRKAMLLNIGVGLTIQTVVIGFASAYISSTPYQYVQLGLVGVALLWLVLTMLYQSRLKN